MLTVIVAAVAGAISALAALAMSLAPVGVVLVAAAGFVLVVLLLGAWNRQSVKGGHAPSLEPRFPTPSRTNPPS